MDIIREGVAGSLESSDALIRVSPGTQGIQMEIESVVLAQFGDDIRRAVLEVAEALGVSHAAISVNDRGALECTLKARVETALLRAAKGGDA